MGDPGLFVEVYAWTWAALFVGVAIAEGVRRWLRR